MTMLIVKVKICGITSLADALAAVDLGADLLGFNFYEKSPRYLRIEQAAEIAAQLPGFVPLVGIFVNADLDFIRQAVRACHLEWVQLHGDEAPEFCEALRGDNVKVMKALRVKSHADIARVRTYTTDAILLDAYHPEAYGGTGVAFDWSLIDHSPSRIFLAGGINPDNAAQAAELGVYGIDICSGVEARPGKKDYEKLRALFENIRYLRG